MRKQTAKQNLLTPFYCDPNIAAHDERRQYKFEKRLQKEGIKYKSVQTDNGIYGLNLSGTWITDLSPLVKLPLTHLCLQGCCGIKDFSPLRDMGMLAWLNLSRTNIKYLSVLKRLPLSYLRLWRTQTSSVIPLRKTQLSSLDIRFTQIVNVSPLESVPLQELFFFPTRMKKGVSTLQNITSLKRINRKHSQEFWNKCKVRN